jgi:hypothetical protein
MGIADEAEHRTKRHTGSDRQREQVRSLDERQAALASRLSLVQLGGRNDAFVARRGDIRLTG